MNLFVVSPGFVERSFKIKMQSFNMTAPDRYC